MDEHKAWLAGVFDRAAPTYDRIGDAYHGHFARRLVELLRRQSNRLDLLEPLVAVVQRIRENDQTEEPGLAEPHHCGVGIRTVAERLAMDGIKAVINLYRSGTTARELSEKFSLSRSSIKRILRDHGVRRRKQESNQGWAVKVPPTLRYFWSDRLRRASPFSIDSIA